MAETRSYQDAREGYEELFAAPALVLGVDCQRLRGPSMAVSLLEVERVVVARGEPGVERRSEDGVAVLHWRFADEWMSSPHAVLERGEGKQWKIADRNSKNGTRVDGLITRQQDLRDGDWIEVGGTFLLFRAARLRDPRGTPDMVVDELADDPLITLCPELALAFGRVRQLAPSDLPILILGETGTGKEVLARAIHRLSKRRGEFVALNCAALPDALVESELFGHVKGAFTGADKDRVGLVRAADGGSLFLDEIGELPVTLQAKLLRVLQEGEVTPLGATRPIPVDIRFLAATNRNVDGEVAADRFRADLLARLSGHRLHLPRLQDRQEDFGLLIARVLRHFGHDGVTIERTAMRQLLSYDWPKNIRELEQTLRASVALAMPLKRIGSVHLPDTITASEEEPVRDRLEDLLRKHGGNISAVARDMGKARVQIRRWCKRFSFDPTLFRH